MTAMPVNEDTEVSKRNVAASVPPFLPESSAVNLLASMIAGTDSPSVVTNPSAGLTLPMLSPSPILPNVLSTPSPTISSFPFGFHDPQESGRDPVAENSSSPVAKQEEVTPQPPRPSIKIKIKKVASTDKYVIETPKGAIKQESVPLTDNTNSQYSSMLESGEFKTDTGAASQYQLGGNMEQFIQPAVSVGKQGMEFSSESMSFTDVDNLSAALLVNSSTGSVPGASGVSEVDGIFQTLPGGATGSPGGLDMEDPYGFDPGLGNVELLVF